MYKENLDRQLREREEERYRVLEEQRNAVEKELNDERQKGRRARDSDQ